MYINPHAGLKQFLKCMRQRNRGSRVEYRINAVHNGVPKEDRHEKDMKDQNHGVNGGSATLKR
jgi:hypothetical protein